MLNAVTLSLPLLQQQLCNTNTTKVVSQTWRKQEHKLRNYSLHTTTSFCMFCMISPAVCRTGDQAAKGQICKHSQAHNSHHCLHRGETWLGEQKQVWPAAMLQGDGKDARGDGKDARGLWGRRTGFPCRHEAGNTLQTRAHSNLSALMGHQHLAMVHRCENALGFPSDML